MFFILILHGCMCYIHWLVLSETNLRTTYVHYSVCCYVRIYICLYAVFIPFRSCYYLLYQCLVPNTREALSLLVQHYSVPKDFERNILSGENPRVCNQGILNYLLIVLRRDKDFVKFWKVVKLLVNHPDFIGVVERIQKGVYICVVLHKYVPKYVYIYMCVCVCIYVCVYIRILVSMYVYVHL